MKRYWQLEYKQELAEVGKPLKTFSEWGRIGKQFSTLEELLEYLRDIVCDYEALKEKPLLEVDASSLEIVGKTYYREDGSIVLHPENEEDLSVVVTTARAVYIEEDAARAEDYQQMKDYVEVKR